MSQGRISRDWRRAALVHRCWSEHPPDSKAPRPVAAGAVRPAKAEATRPVPRNSRSCFVTVGGAVLAEGMGLASNLLRLKYKIYLCFESGKGLEFGRVHKHPPAPVPPEPVGLMADLDAPLRQLVLGLAQRQRVAGAHPYRQADDFGAGLEIPAGGALGYPSRLGGKAGPLREFALTAP